ncbi:MAG: hypothetical protein HC869_12150 [Rhodospirillales bacterium]|nr:hypothetical protein [Rhodospirillales bacterium]
MTQLRAVAVVTGSDTVSNAVGSIENLRGALPSWCDIVMAYSAPPPCLGARVRAAAGNRPFVLHESAVWMSQNRSRNRALEGLPPYDYYLFLDLDSRIEIGGLESAVARARRPVLTWSVRLLSTTSRSISGGRANASSTTPADTGAGGPTPMGAQAWSNFTSGSASHWRTCSAPWAAARGKRRRSSFTECC